MKQFILAFIAIGMLAGCAGRDGSDGSMGPQGPAAPTPVVTEEQQDISNLVADENAYRLGLGQTQLSEGLSCTLYTITGGDRIQASISGHNTLTGISQVAAYLYKGWFNQPDSSINDGMNVLPPALRSLYKNMYLLRCQGQIVVRESNYYNFTVNSDDASVLYIDGSKLVDNDNNHGVTAVSGQKYLRRGVHTIRLDYAQAGGGNQALQLLAGGQFINPIYYYH